MQVNRVATMFIETALETERVNAVAAKMSYSEIGFLPVVDSEGRVRGIVTDRDLVVKILAEDRDPREVTVAEVMSRSVYWVYQNTEIEDACRLMGQHKIRRLLICDHDRRPLGVLSVDDLARVPAGAQALGRVLEDVVQPPNFATRYLCERRREDAFESAGDPRVSGRAA